MFCFVILNILVIALERQFGILYKVLYYNPGRFYY